VNFPLVVSDRAIQQIEKAATWFFEQSPGWKLSSSKKLKGE
jgi:hypothetical protein